MRKTVKAICGIVSGVTLVLGSAAAVPAASTDAGDTPAAGKKMKVEDKAKQNAPVKVKNNAKPGAPVQGSTAKQGKIKNNAKAGQPSAIWSSQVETK
ncbi:MAG: hypothetical protein GX423_05165 [Nitrospiraceae bacterium]|jgi:hypothetical protein|nr:hypothetical protein [Nitrospiraceae bacterium]